MKIAILNKENINSMRFFVSFLERLNRFRIGIQLILLLLLVLFPYVAKISKVIALNSNQGEIIFINNCAGCHVNGGNIIRRKKTLKLKDLKKNGLDNQAAIAKIAREGIGIMDGYEDVLGLNGDKIVAKWVLEQSQRAWVQG